MRTQGGVFGEVNVGGVGVVCAGVVVGQGDAVSLHVGGAADMPAAVLPVAADAFAAVLGDVRHGQGGGFLAAEVPGDGMGAVGLEGFGDGEQGMRVGIAIGFACAQLVFAGGQGAGFVEEDALDAGEAVEGVAVFDEDGVFVRVVERGGEHGWRRQR